MKTIDTLVEDIQNVFQLPHEFSEDRLERFSKRLAKAVVNKVNPKDRIPRLSMSMVGTRCLRKLWFQVNKADKAENLPVEAKVKFLYGDILEHLLLFLAEEAGHSVQGCQDEVLLEGIPGSRDAVIDGVLVDVKSASSMAFQKFKKGLTYAEDDFGYVDQLQGYLKASINDPLVTDHTRAAFLVIDKQLGHICLDIHPRSDLDFAVLAKIKKDAVAAKAAPARLYKTEPDGYTNNKTKQFVPNGNEKLCTVCSYCAFKKACWPGLRTFVYANGPKYLTKVVKAPEVPEAA